SLPSLTTLFLGRPYTTGHPLRQARRCRGEVTRANAGEALLPIPSDQFRPAPQRTPGSDGSSKRTTLLPLQVLEALLQTVGGFLELVQPLAELLEALGRGGLADGGHGVSGMTAQSRVDLAARGVRQRRDGPLVSGLPQRLDRRVPGEDPRVPKEAQQEIHHLALRVAPCQISQGLEGRFATAPIAAVTGAFLEEGDGPGVRQILHA